MRGWVYLGVGVHGGRSLWGTVCVHPAPERTAGERRHSVTGLGGFGGA